MGTALLGARLLAAPSVERRFGAWAMAPGTDGRLCPLWKWLSPSVGRTVYNESPWKREYRTFWNNDEPPFFDRPPQLQHEPVEWNEFGEQPDV